MQKLHIIMVTSPELADFRKRLKNLETRVRLSAAFVAFLRSDRAFLVCSKMGKRCSRRYIGRGVTMPCLCFRCVCWLRRMSMRQICFTSCKPSPFFVNKSELTLSS